MSLDDTRRGKAPIEGLDLKALLGHPPRLERQASRLRPIRQPLVLDSIVLAEAVERVLRFPAVAAKTFLITIADRTVGGLVARDQMVGPYQVPVADLAIVCHSFKGYTGTALAVGERTPLALVDAPASGRIALAEAITNLAGAFIGPIEHIKVSGNWMAACGQAGEDAALYDTVQALGVEFCPALGVSIPTGKDSLSMSTPLDRPCRGQTPGTLAGEPGGHGGSRPA